MYGNTFGVWLAGTGVLSLILSMLILLIATRNKRQAHKYWDEAHIRHAQSNSKEALLLQKDRQLNIMAEALHDIYSWDRFPATGIYWPTDRHGEIPEEISFTAAYGSNGARDFMRIKAGNALNLCGRWVPNIENPPVNPQSEEV